MTPHAHITHSEPDEQLLCDDPQQSGSFTQTVTPTGYEPKITETEAGSEVIPKDLKPKRS